EKAVLEQLIKQEDRQYKVKEENIDIINRKCHDLKHQLSEIRKLDESGNRENIKEIENAILIYDRFAKTGNKALDIILSEKSLLCEKYGIRFTYMADGSLLDSMSPTDVATVFGNALDNCIEYLQKADVEKCIMGLQIFGNADMVTVHIENWCGDAPEMSDGLPVTTKDDKNFHGYGMKSIKYIVERYNGNMVVNTTNNRFSLDLLFSFKKNT
ncbi:MAG: sensor histidine kinase, partial [Clostridia bacterium]|nr:sensor histidine kinase [Clostridia bacterium]